MSATSSPSAPRIRTLLVDDHNVVRLGLRALLGSSANIEVVGEASHGHEALKLALELKPDVVIMDVSLASDMDGVETTRKLVELWPAAQVLALTMHDEEAYLVPLLAAGALGYVVKSEGSTTLLRAIETVAQGQRFVRPEAASLLADALLRKTHIDSTYARYQSLSERERTVFLLIAQGYSSTKIGSRLFISAKTADTYRRRINEKLDINERADYIRLALEMGLLSAESNL